MKDLKDSIEINVSPDKIFNWLEHFAENYLDWHPDHVKAYWLEKNSMEVGAILYAEEKIHGELHKLKFRLKKIEPNRKIEFQNLFPMSLISPKGSFIIEPKGNASLFTATLSFRFGSLLSTLAKKRVEALQKHVKEEGENLKTILEK